MGLPLTKVGIPTPCPHEVYDALMEGAMKDAAANGVGHVIFGDIFPEGIRAYREERLAKVGMSGITRCGAWIPPNSRARPWRSESRPG